MNVLGRQAPTLFLANDLSATIRDFVTPRQWPNPNSMSVESQVGIRLFETSLKVSPIKHLRKSAESQAQRSHIAAKLFPQLDWNRGIGSVPGLIESTAKQLVVLRIKGPGMQSSPLGESAVTARRADSFNENWHNIWNSISIPKPTATDKLMPLWKYMYFNLWFSMHD